MVLWSVIGGSPKWPGRGSRTNKRMGEEKPSFPPNQRYASRDLKGKERGSRGLGHMSFPGSGTTTTCFDGLARFGVKCLGVWTVRCVPHRDQSPGAVLCRGVPMSSGLSPSDPGSSTYPAKRTPPNTVERGYCLLRKLMPRRTYFSKTKNTMADPTRPFSSFFPNRTVLPPLFSQRNRKGSHQQEKKKMRARRPCKMASKKAASVQVHPSAQSTLSTRRAAFQSFISLRGAGPSVRQNRSHVADQKTPIMRGITTVPPPARAPAVGCARSAPASPDRRASSSPRHRPQAAR